MLKNWTNIFLYHIKNNKLFTALNVLGLSIGIAGLIFAILYWNDEHSYNDWNPNKESVFLVVNVLGDDVVWANSPGPVGASLQKNTTEIASHCYMNLGYYEERVQYKNKKQKFVITDAQNNFFDFFPFEFIKGNPKNCLSKTSVAISDAVAKKLFGNEDPMNKTIDYSGRKLAVKGIYIANRKSAIAPEMVTNLIDGKLNPENNPWGNFNFGLFVKLKNVNAKQKIEAVIEKLHYENNLLRWAKDEGLTPEEYLKKYDEKPMKIVLESLKDSRLHSITNDYPEAKGNYQFLMIMMGLSLLILVLSIVNYINLATANAIKRAKEVGVRKIIGASKSNIIKQFIFETVLITSFSILLALVIVELSLPYYNEFLGKKLVIFGSQFYLQLVLIFIITIVVAGIFPAVYVSNFETLKVLKGNFGRSKSGIWLRNGMLVFQFAIATFFIVGFYIVFQQIKYISNKDLGFKGDQVLSINYRNKYDWKEKGYEKKIYDRYNMVKAEISKIKGVEQVATGAFSFGNGSGSSSSFQYKNANIQSQNMGVDFGMLEMMQIKIKEGRSLSEKFASDTINSMLINEVSMKMMGEKNPIGKEIDWNGTKLKIVGVVKDFHLFGPQAEIPPMVFFHFKTINWMLQNTNKIHVKVKKENMDQTIDDIEKFWIKNVDAEDPFTYDFVDKQYARTYETYVKQKNLFSLLNVIVILIALFGLFSLASFSIERRMKEIAIRKTLGAETNTLLKELSKQYVIYCVVGFLLALFPVYYLLNRWLENFAFRITISVLPFLLGFVMLLSLTLVVVLSRAYHATRLDVLKYLKYE
ncbi:ABC transporter permease [Flavobacterium succinicans]|uniref:Macrolide export ATP-binding/permease protein MacB n=1 Tax=Flavobacterium succinicans TaxID=29536 RepID=A0A199XRQ9_9FLAO|nr:FtsX-like permease family protein [Flavobacterium succinicans]OAZ03941.1 macrolide export ATP-binding/permease protein MacB [Flavobacterium succinicans]